MTNSYKMEIRSEQNRKKNVRRTRVHLIPQELNITFLYTLFTLFFFCLRSSFIQKYENETTRQKILKQKPQDWNEEIVSATTTIKRSTFFFLLLFVNVLRTSYYRHYRNLNASLSASESMGKKEKHSFNCLFRNDVTHENVLSLTKKPKFSCTNREHFENKSN